MPELLTRRETPQSVVGRLAGFKSEWWPTSIRNDGRLPVGISGRLQSESAGMRAHEMASLRLGDVLGEDGRVRDEITLDPSQTKPWVARSQNTPSF